jgi:hypothetical protein
MKMCYCRIDFAFSYLFFLYLQLLSFLLKEKDYDPIMNSSKYLPVYSFKMVLFRLDRIGYTAVVKSSVTPENWSPKLCG